MIKDVDRLTVQQMHYYAVGYTDALEDSRQEQDRLNIGLTELATRLDQAEAAADRYYHAAFCSCQHPHQRKSQRQR